jgi:hypothetical protein
MEMVHYTHSQTDNVCACVCHMVLLSRKCCYNLFTKNTAVLAVLAVSGCIWLYLATLPNIVRTVILSESPGLLLTRLALAVV